MSKRSIAVIGVGKIAVDQHLPVISKSDRFELAATVSTRGVRHEGLPVFATPGELYAAMPEIELVAICTPPAQRCAIAREALAAGKDVLLEKPPATTLSEFADVAARGRAAGRVLFQTWHSQYNAAVDETRALLAREGVASLRIDWRESVRKWHPGQDWVWQAGGFGVFDPGINALSILAKIMPFPVFVESAALQVPSNRQTPVDVEMVFGSGEPGQPRLSAGFNWLEERGEIWGFASETRSGRRLSLEKGGTVLKVNNETKVNEPSEEYERIYERFAGLLDSRSSEMDDTPLRWVADAFLLATRKDAPAFSW